jgi:hypothetical protein
MQTGGEKPKDNAIFNLIKAVAIVALIFYGGIALLSSLFDKKHIGKPIEYTILYTTINGHYYEKEETAADLTSDFVAFSDGTRVSWADIKSKKADVYPDELGAGTNSFH